MKKMTCKQLGGACDMEFRADSFREIAELSKKHGMEMFRKGDAAHLEAMGKMKESMMNPEKMKKWMREKEKEFDELDEEERQMIKIETTVHASIDKVWEAWTLPEHITKWNSASEDWHTPWAKNDLKVGGEFTYRMEAKDGSFGFDFGGVYTAVKNNELIEYTIGDGRKVRVEFHEANGKVKVVEEFEAESQNPIEMQRGGWQAILDNFRKYVEGK